MWNIFEPDQLGKIIWKLPHAVQDKYELWKAVVRYSGTQALRGLSGFHDEKLKGRRAGQRSSRLSLKYRVIYAVEKNTITVRVIEITPHKY